MIGVEQGAQCPECDAALAPTFGFVTWCEGCDWNLRPGGDRETPKGRWARRQAALGTRAVHQLFRELEGKPPARPGWDLARVTAYGLAIFLHLTTLAMLGGGALLLLARPHWLFLPVGGVVVGGAIFLGPTPGRISKNAVTLSRDEAPELYRLLDEVAAAIGARSVDVVVIDGDVNASFGTVGWRRRNVLVIGLPLWVMLEQQERVALLGHELAHGVNGDARRGFVIGSAIRTLGEWYRSLRSPQVRMGGLAGLTQFVAIAVLYVARLVVRGYYAALKAASRRSGQRAEYLADAKAAQVAGTVATVSLLRTLNIADSVHFAMQRAVSRHERDVLRSAAELRPTIPPTEWVRRQRLAELAELSVDATHPPTILRERLLLSRPAEPGLTAMSTYRDRVITEELLGVKGAEVERELVQALTYVR